MNRVGRILILALLTPGLPALAMAARRPRAVILEDSIVGKWNFYKMISGGQEMPPRDPRLDLEYEFKADGSDRLYWTYDEGKTFCEREGKYAYAGGFLNDEITSVNPQNAEECSNDVDMQMGRKTSTQLDLQNGELYLHMPLGEEELIYVWKKLGS